MNNSFKRFIFLLTFVITITFALHLLYLGIKNIPLFDNKIILAYILNYVLALGIYSLLYLYRVKLKNQLGFLFMVGSFLKFITFFLFFYSFYKADGIINSLEFASFFIPYIICLIIETTALISLLKKLS